MCFKRKKKEPINSLYHIGDFVSFRDEKRGLTPGLIYEVKLDKDQKVIYDIQIGGECPAFYYNISEDKVILRKRKEK